MAGRVLGTSGDALPLSLLLLGFQRPHGLSRNRDHGAFSLVFRKMFHKSFDVLLHLRVLLEFVQHSLVHLFTAVIPLKLVQDHRSFQPLTRHRLDAFPMFWVLFDIFVDSRVDLGILFESGFILSPCRGGRF